MNINSITKIFFTLFLLSITSKSFGQIIIAAEPSWKIPLEQNYPKPNAKTIEGGYYDLLFENQEHIELEEDYVHVIRKIESTDGVQYGSQIEVVFNPAYQKLSFHKIVIKRRGKEINKLVIQNFKIESNEKESSRFIYNGTKNALLILDDVRQGDELEYSYTLKGRNPIFAHKYFGTMYTTTSYSIGLLYQTLIFSKGRKLNFKENYQKQKANVFEKNGLVIYEWKQELPPLYDYEEYTPEWYDDKPNVQVSEMNSWADVANWALPMYKVDGVLSSGLKQMADEWKNKSKGNPLIYTQYATQFVQDEIRYMGFETGVNSHKPTLPETVFRQRFGDCKDKALLLSNLLKYNNIESYPALVNSYGKNKNDAFLPSPHDFNHVITFAKIGTKDFWIDGTLSNERGTTDKLFVPDYGKALIIKANQTELSNIVSNNIGKSKIVENYIIPKIGEPGQLSVKSVYTGNYADNMRSLFSTSSLGEIEKLYTDFYYSIYPKSKLSLTDSLVYEDNGAENIFTTSENYTITNFWTAKDSVTKKHEILIYGKLLLDRLRFLKATSVERKAPIAISFPFEIDYDIIVEFPETWSIEEKDFSIDRPSYSFQFKSEYFESTKSWTLHYYYKALKDNVPASELEQYNADLTKIETALSRSVTWNPDAEADYGYNWWMISLALICLGLFIFFGLIYYKRSLPKDIFYRKPHP